MPIQANIIDGIYFQVTGEAGKTNGLAWHVIEEMGYRLQELVHLLAKYDLEIPNSPKLKDFEIEIFDFQPGSAIPAFRLTPTHELPLIESVAQRVGVADRLDKLLSVADSGKYEVFFDQYNLLDVKQDIAEQVYGLTLAADNSPINVVKLIPESAPTKIYHINRFNRLQQETLLKPRRVRQKKEIHEMLGLIRTVGTRRKIIDIYEGKETVLSFAPPTIVTLEKVYHLHSPLLCKVVKENDHFIIEHEMLDLYASGKTIDEAEFDFYREFDASYQWYGQTPNDKLSDRLLRAKQTMFAYVKEITKN